MRDTGALTIARDEASSVVFGMPHMAIKLGGIDKAVPLGKIAQEVLRAIQDASGHR